MPLRRAKELILDLLTKRKGQEERWKSKKYMELTDRQKYLNIRMRARINAIRQQIYGPETTAELRSHTTILLNQAKQMITQGKNPILLLPDTSMRIAGHLFHSAFMEAFPDVYRGLKQYRLGPVVYIPTITTNTGACIPDLSKISWVPEILKRVKNLRPIIVDTIGSRDTVRSVQNDLTRLGLDPASEFSFIEDTTNILKRAEKARRFEDNVGYTGRGGVLKIDQGPPGTEPKIVTARESDYHPRYNFWLEKEYKSYLSRMGRELGQRFKERELKK
jgi:hypothetical protein